MKNLDMKKKIILSFGVVVAIFLVAMVVTFLSLQSTGNDYSSFYNVTYGATQRAERICTNLQCSTKNIVLSTIATDTSKINELISDAEENVAEINEDIAWLDTNFVGDTTSLDKFKSIVSSTESIRNEILELSRQNTDATDVLARQMVMDEYEPASLEAEEYMQQFSAEQTALAATEYRKVMNNQNIQIALSVVLSVGAIVVAFIMGVLLIRLIVPPIREMEEVMQGMEQGQLDVMVHYDSKDELGVLAESMRAVCKFLHGVIGDMGYILGSMSEGDFSVHSKMEDRYVGEYKSLLASIRKLRLNMSDTLGQINVSADQVASGSDQVSSGAQALSQGATEQASSVEELAATINEISNNIGQNAESAKNASDKSDHVKEQADDSSNRMQEMLSAMQDISDTSGEIGKIIKTIEDIAFQTNILALNAAVEAARAGAAGKGFAVVADEVRNLAGKSADASKNTSSLIERSLQAVERGSKIASETAQALGEVVTGVEDVATTISKISTASEEQSEAVKQVTLGIDQISSVVQTNSATAQESAAASQELSGQSQILKNLVSQFKLDNGKPSASSTVSMPVSAPAPLPVSAAPVEDTYTSSYMPAAGGDKY